MTTYDIEYHLGYDLKVIRRVDADSVEQVLQTYFGAEQETVDFVDYQDTHHFFSRTNVKLVSIKEFKKPVIKSRSF